MAGHWPGSDLALGASSPVKFAFRFNPAWRRRLASGDRRHWLLRSIALHIEVRTTPLWSVEIFWRRLLLGAGLAGLLGYLVVVTALFWWWSRNPHNQTTWADFARAPVAWSDFRAKRGDTVVATALARLREGDFVEGFHGLRTGLVRSPGNVAGRIMLARLYRGSDPARALATLEEGLPGSASDLTFLHALVGAYLDAGAPQRALDRTATLLAPGATAGLGPEARAFLGLTRVELLLGRGEVAAAAAEWGALAPPREPDAARRHRELRVGVLLRLGRAEEAARLLVEAAKVGERGPAEFRAAAELAVAREDEGGLTSALRAWLAAEPDRSAPYLYAYETWHRMQRPTQRAAAEQQFYAAFGGQEAALQRFAALAVQLGLPEVVQRARQVAQGSGLSPFAFQVLQTEIELGRGEFDAAFRSLALWEEYVTELGPAQRVHPEFVRRLVRACFVGQAGVSEPLMAGLMATRGRLPVGSYVFALDRLVRAGRVETARAVAALGRRLYPHAEALRLAAEKLVEPARGGAETVGAAEAEAMVVAPKLADPWAGAARDWPTAAAALDGWSVPGREAEGVKFLDYLRARPPGWAAAARDELTAREVRLRLALDQRTRALMAFRELVGRAGRPRAAAFRLVRELWAEGELDAAVLLAREVGRWLPDDPAAARLLSEVETAVVAPEEP